VVLDLAMPELNGAATLKEIRKDWAKSRYPPHRFR